MKREMALVILLVILTSINSVIASNDILLKSRRFTPSKGISAAAKAKIEAIPRRAHVLIQLEQIPTVNEREELKAKGIKLLSYVPNKAWFASIPSDKVDEIASLSGVRAISEILPEDKISPAVRERGVGDYSTNEDGTANLTIKFFRDISLDEAIKIVTNYGGTIIGEAPIINALEVIIPSESISELANEDAVQWLNEFPPPPVLFNDGSRAAIGVDIVQAPPYSLTGTGVIAG